MPSMQSSSTVAGAMSVADRPGSRLLHTIGEFLIRRRILISAVLFAILIAQDVAYGPKPHDPVNFRDPFTVLGVSLVVTGLALRSWSAGILRKNAELTMTGPYGLIRNPLYLGSFMMMFGFCALIADPTNFLFILGPILVIYVVKVRQEEKLLAERFPDQWAVYSKTTPRFVPGLRIPDVSAEWSLSQWLRHREYQAVLASILALAAFEAWHLM
jgi:protein-S-isoprenylcysteine O-methyltransferase Ste14